MKALTVSPNHRFKLSNTELDGLLKVGRDAQVDLQPPEDSEEEQTEVPAAAATEAEVDVPGEDAGEVKQFPRLPHLIENRIGRRSRRRRYDVLETKIDRKSTPPSFTTLGSMWSGDAKLSRLPLAKHKPRRANRSAGRILIDHDNALAISRVQHLFYKPVHAPAGDTARE